MILSLPGQALVFLFETRIDRHKLHVWIPLVELVQEIAKQYAFIEGMLRIVELIRQFRMII